jgi:hypothetical protein
MGGDILLLGRSEAWFLSGLTAFLVAHLAYTAGFLRNSRAWKPLLLVVCLLWTVPVFLYLLPDIGDMTIPVAAYVVAITVMMWRALARVGSAGKTDIRQVAAAAGAVLFAASDTLLALNRFHAPIADVGYAVMITYWLGQWGIAWSVRSKGRGPSTPDKAVSALAELCERVQPHGGRDVLFRSGTRVGWWGGFTVPRSICPTRSGMPAIPSIREGGGTCGSGWAYVRTGGPAGWHFRSFLPPAV